MTSELKANAYVSEFVSGVQKNYAYEVFNSITGEVKTVCKVRAYTLYYKASHLVNLETIKDLVLKGRLNSNVTVRTYKK